MNAKISGSEIIGATVILHEDVLSAAFLANMTVELYVAGVTVSIGVGTQEEAMSVFKHFGVDWHYGTPNKAINSDQGSANGPVK